MNSEKSKMHNSAVGDSWDSVRAELFTPEEIAECDLKVALIGELIKARQEKGISQKKLEELTGIKQPVIARLEKGITNPKLGTILKILMPLGLTLAIVPIDEKYEKQCSITNEKNQFRTQNI